MSSKDALRELRANAGTQFNPVVVEAFIATIDAAGQGSAAAVGAPVQNDTTVFQHALAAVRARAS
jgi:HD-GYP domain-containing protein (c-di-GMP phosphodiesterase class II)